MAKVNGWKSALSVIVACGIIATLTARAVVVGTFHGEQSQLIESTTKAVEGLKEEGCDPVRQLSTDVAVIREQITHMQEDVTEQKADIKAIREAVEK